MSTDQAAKTNSAGIPRPVSLCNWEARRDASLAHAEKQTKGSETIQDTEEDDK